MDTSIVEQRLFSEAVMAQESSESSQLAGFNNIPDAEAGGSSPPREQSSNEPEESDEYKKLKVIPNGSVVRIILNNRNSKGKAASYLGGEAIVVSSANNGMGGWHEVQTADGKLIKLQRNSLVVRKIGHLSAASPQTAQGAEYTEQRQRLKRPQDSEVSETRKRPRRQAAGRNAPTADSYIQPGAAFARNVSKASVEKYAEAYNLKLAGGTNTWQQMLEECCQHYRTEQEAVNDDQLPNLLISVHLALKKNRCNKE